MANVPGSQAQSVKALNKRARGRAKRKNKNDVILDAPAEVVVVVEVSDVEGSDWGVDESDADPDLARGLGGADGRQELAFGVAGLGSSPGWGDLADLAFDDWNCEETKAFYRRLETSASCSKYESYLGDRRPQTWLNK